MEGGRKEGEMEEGRKEGREGGREGGRKEGREGRIFSAFFLFLLVSIIADATSAII